MKTSIWVTHRKQPAAFRIVGLVLAIIPLCLILATPNTSTNAQTSDKDSNPTAVTTSSPADWTEFHRDNMQRWNPYETVLGVNSVRGLQVSWKTPIGGNFHFTAPQSAPAIVNGVVYFGDYDSHVYALNAHTGAKLWSFATGDTVFSSPAVANGVVYVGSNDGNVYALNATTGAKLWSFATGGIVVSDPAVVNGVVYIGSSVSRPTGPPVGYMYALNATTGAKLWSFAAGNFINLSPAVANGMVYFDTNEGNVYALNATTGILLWSYTNPMDSGIINSPAVANGVIYVGSRFGNMYALNATTGAKVWSVAVAIGGNAQNGSFDSPAVANGVVYIGSVEFSSNADAEVGKVYALDAATGAKLWSVASNTPFYTSPAVANGVVYATSNGGVYALNATTGAYLWSYSDGGEWVSHPSIVDGILYARSFTTTRSNFYAFSLGTSNVADLFLRIFPSTTTVHQGDLLTYAFPVWNLGPDSAVHEVLNTQVPPGTTFDYLRISGTPGLGTCTHPPYQGTGQIVCRENASMAPNTTWTVRLTVKVTAPSGSTITESAATMADSHDPNMANNMATVGLKVQ
jgi:outer membrane protein assembly factor BamB